MVCRVCRKDLPEDNFSLRLKNSNKRHSICLSCKRKYDQNIIDNKKYDLSNWLKSEFGNCIKCDESRLHLLDFHHIEPDKKEINVSRLLNGTASLETTKKRLVVEAQRCVRLCSNCHRDYHHQHRNTQVSIEEYLR